MALDDSTNSSILLFMQRPLTLILLFCLVCLPACMQQPGAPAAESPSATPTGLTPVAVLPPQGTPIVSPTGANTPAAGVPVNITPVAQLLIIWLPPEIATRTTPGSETFLQQLQQVTADIPNLEVRVEQKAVSGQGGMLNYLRTGRHVAPDILPDLIILPVEQLGAALNDSLIYPLNGLLDEAALGALYPAARTLAQPDAQIAGYPLAITGLGHLAYTPGVFSEGPARTWEELLALPGQSLVIAGGGRAGATLALQLYLDAGGVLINETGQSVLQVEPLRRALEQLAAGRASGLIATQSGSAGTIMEAWQLFMSGGGTMVQTTADQLLLTQTTGRPLAYAPLPGINGRLIPLVNGWAWAVSTPEPAQQRLAVQVMLALMEAERLAAWSYASGILPARQDAFALWPQDNAYVAFLGPELLLARPFPTAATNTIMGILGNAVADVLSQAKTPQVAAEEASAALRP